MNKICIKEKEILPEVLKITPEGEIYYKGKFFRKDKELGEMLIDFGRSLTGKILQEKEDN